MNYWHLQMHMPEGREQGGTIIDPLEMLKEQTPVIGTGDWDNIQCRHFKGEQDGLQIGSIVMVREGNKPLALVEVISDYFRDDKLEEKYINCFFRKVKILDFNTEEITSSLFSQGTLKKLYESSNTDSWKFINNWYLKISNNIDMHNIIELLKYKKQIILQGPPGTGKTKLAKELAEHLCPVSSITDKEIKEMLHVGLKISSADNYTEYTITDTGLNNVTVQLKDSTSSYKPSYKEIINAFNIKMWEGKQKGGNDPYAAAIAKFIYMHFQNSNYIKIVQFHPSYSYEDFVRGIVAKPNPDGEGILYEAENKILGQFAELALKNYQESISTDATINSDNEFGVFVAEVLSKIDEEEKYMISDKVYIYFVDNNRFKYKGDNWTAHPNGLNMNFSELKKILNLGLNTRQEIVQNESLNSLTRQHATYYQKVLDLYKKFLLQQPKKTTLRSELKNYILIIDEINRANLSSVLGELIYALEYRGEPVESMYEVNGERKLTLPPNLYIIGTMNTADRSVGHIDYAIRRRFAFVDVQPKDLSGEEGIVFSKKLFDEVADFFRHDTHLSAEFEPKDVQLGHSYFIDKSEDGGSMDIRLEYEIKPILREYVKDGILIDDDIKDIIEKLSV